MALDPNKPNVQHLAHVVNEILDRYALTHTDAECKALVQKVEQDRIYRQRMFGTPQPVPLVRAK